MGNQIRSTYSKFDDDWTHGNNVFVEKAIVLLEDNNLAEVYAANNNTQIKRKRRYKKFINRNPISTALAVCNDNEEQIKVQKFILDIDLKMRFADKYVLKNETDILIVARYNLLKRNGTETDWIGFNQWANEEHPERAEHPELGMEDDQRHNL